ncbi:MAG: Uma2 family endonuclease, partial [Cyanobacteria bacterium P01_D01_bin.123]
MSPIHHTSSEAIAMTATRTRMSFQDYLTYDDGTDTRYELVRGELVVSPLPTTEHSDVIDRLRDIFRDAIRCQNREWLVKVDIGTYVATSDRNSETSRYPDLCIITREQWAEIKGQTAVILSPPQLIVEIVSTNWQDDY